METEGGLRAWLGREVRVQLRDPDQRGRFEEVRGTLRSVDEFGTEVELRHTTGTTRLFYPWSAVRSLRLL